MKIKGTEWYTASAYHFEKIKESERCLLTTLYGYRMPVAEKKEAEIKELKDLLKSDGITTKLKTSQHDHTGIPKGTPFLEVMDEASVIALEKLFLEKGIDLPKDRYKEYGLEYINRTPNKLSLLVKKSFWDRLFGRK